nr:waprin-Enh1-like [Anolis sagrei ordinatus]
MKMICTIFLVGFLTLWTKLPSVSGLPPIHKVGTCPPNPFRCSVPGHNACNIDYDCPGIKKCCYWNCGKICKYPQDKPGSCPVLPYICSIPGGDVCNHDYDCPGNQKCCYISCGKKCAAP